MSDNLVSEAKRRLYLHDLDAETLRYLGDALDQHADTCHAAECESPANTQDQRLGHPPGSDQPPTDIGDTAMANHTSVGAGNGLVNAHANTPHCSECRKARHSEDLAAILAAERDAEITPEIAAALDGKQNRATVGPQALPNRPTR